jgi:hypothetical protein
MGSASCIAMTTSFEELETVAGLALGTLVATGLEDSSSFGDMGDEDCALGVLDTVLFACSNVLYGTLAVGDLDDSGWEKL